MNSFERFNEKKLPARKYFFSSTKKGKISDDGKISDGHMLKIIWHLKKIRVSLRWKIWVIITIINWKKMHCYVFKIYWLDPCHYYSSPGISWDAMFKMTGVKFEKISDIDKYLFIERGLRGGILYMAKRHAKANNKYMNG